MFHYTAEATTYRIAHHDWPLFMEDDKHLLLKPFSFYILDRLHTYQNMQDYAVSPGFDVTAYVSHSTTLHDGTIIYRFSKELLAYLETLVAFSPYYSADDPRSTAHINKHFKSALANYKDISYEQLHEYLTELLTAWYEENPPAASSKRRVSLLEEGEVGDVLEPSGALTPAVPIPPAKRFSMETPKSRAAVAPPAAAAATAAPPAGAAAALANE